MEPQGFRRSVDSGLLLPPDISRKRQVLTKQQWKLLERCTVMLKGLKIDLFLSCQNETCRKAGPLQAKRLGDGSFRLRCECTDRIMTRAY